MDIVTLYIVVILFFMFGGFLFILKKSSNNKANLYMGLFLFAIGISTLQNLFKELSTGVYFFGIPVSYTIGVSLYFYIHATMHSKSISAKNLFRHYGIAVLLLSYLFIDEQLLTSNEHATLNHNMHFFKLDLSIRSILFMGMMGSFFVYVWLCLRKISKYQQLILNYSADNTIDTLSWFYLLLKLLVALGIIDLILLLSNVPRNIITLVPVSMIVVVFAIIVKAFYQPHIFEGFDVETLEKSFMDEEKSKADDQKEIMSVVNQHLSSTLSFTKTDYSLKKIADEINIPSYKISKTINAECRENFSAFINRYRVNLSKDILRNTENDNLTIEAIAEQVGFNNKVSFIAAFKKFEGNTPHAFRLKERRQYA